MGRNRPRRPTAGQSARHVARNWRSSRDFGSAARSVHAGWPTDHRLVRPWRDNGLRLCPSGLALARRAGRRQSTGVACPTFDGAPSPDSGSATELKLSGPGRVGWVGGDPCRDRDLGGWWRCSICSIFRFAPLGIPGSRFRAGDAPTPESLTNRPVDSGCRLPGGGRAGARRNQIFARQRAELTWRCPSSQVATRVSHPVPARPVEKRPAGWLSGSRSGDPTPTTLPMLPTFAPSQRSRNLRSRRRLDSAD